MNLGGSGRDKCSKLKFSDQILIAHKVLVENEKYADISKAYGVTVSRISQIVHGIRKNRNIFQSKNSE